MQEIHMKTTKTEGAEEAANAAKAKPSERYLQALQKRYARASKKERGRMLDEFVKTSGYHRKHASEVLSGRFRRKARPWRRRRARYYTDADRQALWQVAEWFDQIGSKRLRAALDVELPRLRAAGHLQVSDQTYQHLEEMSSATMDRIRALKPVAGRALRGGTKPGSLLKSQVPIRTFADWDDKRIGFVEVDLVQHDGGNARGIFACTLTLTDVCTGWTEVYAVRNKAQKNVFAGLKAERARLPFRLQGVDSDNGAEFINDQLIRYCSREHLTFTRGRVGRKNDNAFVEQKNWSVVRRLVGYDRYDTPKQVKQINRLYEVYRLYVNFFLPVTKLIRKERQGNRVIKIYDTPRTPYQRVLDSPDVPEDAKQRLRQQYASLDMVKLKQEIDALIAQLLGTKL
jgi:hypothetical protein